MAQGRLSLALPLEVALFTGPPQIDTELRALVRRISAENPLWGAPRTPESRVSLHSHQFNNGAAISIE